TFGNPNVRLQNVNLDGYTPTSPTGCTSCTPFQEAALDIEMVLAMAPGLDQVTIYGINGNETSIIDAITEIANPTQGEPRPNQISNSNGFFYTSNLYSYYRQLGMGGQAFFNASGDFGSYNESSGSGDFAPNDEPWVVSVGGTVLTTATAGGT